MKNIDFAVTEVVSTVKRSCDSEWHMKNLSYEEEYALVLAIDGEADYTVNSEQIKVSKNDVFLFSPRVLRSAIANKDNPWKFICIVFKMQLSEDAAELLDKAFICFKGVGEGVQSAFLSAESAWRKKQSLYHVRAKNAVSEILCSLIEFLTAVSTVPHIKKLESAREYIQSHYKERISISDLATRLDFSVSYFRKLYKEAFGSSPMQYVTELRLAMAKDMLLSGELSVGEIAYFCGFDDIYYFSTIFKKHFGFSPSRLSKGGREV